MEEHDLEGLLEEFFPKELSREEKLLQCRNEHCRRHVPEPVFMSGYADASFKADPPDQGGGWGIWVRDHHTRVVRSGVCPEWVESSVQAEFCAVWAAIYTALTHLDTQRCNILVIKTDCQEVAKYFGWSQNQQTPSDPNVVRICLKAYEMAKSHGIKLVVKWVRGHQRKSKDNVPGYLNDRVDELASKARLTKTGVNKIGPIYKPGPMHGREKQILKKIREDCEARLAKMKTKGGTL